VQRSGAVEGDTGGNTVEHQSNKMANTVNGDARLRKTFNPVNVASVRRFDEAWAKGALDSGTAAVRNCHIGPLRQPLTAVKPAKSLK
jgi:hypothetical protein